MIYRTAVNETVSAENKMCDNSAIKLREFFYLAAAGSRYLDLFSRGGNAENVQR